MISRMIRDLMGFLTFVFLDIFGFGIAIQAVANPTVPIDWRTAVNVVYR